MPCARPPNNLLLHPPSPASSLLDPPPRILLLPPRPSCSSCSLLSILSLHRGPFRASLLESERASSWPRPVRFDHLDPVGAPLAIRTIELLGSAASHRLVDRPSLRSYPVRGVPEALDDHAGDPADGPPVVGLRAANLVVPLRAAH
eukprot:5156506-Pyramimonas_sp.AAC.1